MTNLFWPRCAFVALLLVMAFAPAASAQTSDAEAVEAVEEIARGILAAISAGDSTAFMSYMLPGAKVYSPGRGSIRSRDVANDAAGLANSTQAYLERMWEPTVMVDGDLAVVWTRYDFWLDGQFSHCGTDTFTMMKDGETWRMASLAYNFSQDCEPGPLGPPTF
ncbi:MAG: hypothetical protein ACI80V_003530 [Rhodothermales bacterium]|jgi:hypothetical protein